MFFNYTHLIPATYCKCHLRERLANLAVSLVAGGMPKRSQAHDQPHLTIEFVVDHLGIKLRPLGQMYRFRSIDIEAAHQVLVQGFGHKRHGGSDQLADRHQSFVHGRVGGLLIGIRFALPETAATAAQVPVGKDVHKSLNRPCSSQYIIMLQGLGHITDQGMQGRTQPLVNGAVFKFGSGIRLPSIQVGVGHEEGICIPERQREGAQYFAHQVTGEAAFLPGRAGRIQIPSCGIRAVLIQHFPR
ncbi:hypothetical protein SDC9_117004 [bioreactor metagenome]|uniref:Uncharacterized protein n=1 Tax=bioreactor metagenome TaxID=1076179 RepID=A0A645C3X9_9ZZZZ